MLKLETMGPPVEIRHYSLSEYIALEDAAEIKSEFFDGEIYAMAGATPAHSAIALNCAAAMKSALKPNNCRVFESSLRIQVKALNNVLYPDASVFCAPLESNPESPTLVWNPSLLLEVLSKSTQNYDRGSKFHMYQMIPSLQTYVLVSQNQPRVYVHFKTKDGTWDVTHYFGLDQHVELKPLGVSISMADIYEWIEF